MFFGVVF